MTMQAIRARVRAGRLEPVDPSVRLPVDGSEVIVVVDLPEQGDRKGATTLKGRFPQLGGLSDADLDEARRSWGAGALHELEEIKREKPS